MASGNIQLSFSADSAAIVRELARQEAKVNELTARVKELKTAHNEAGAAGEQAGNRVERATGPAAKAAWEENRAIREVKKGWEEHAKAAEQAGQTSDSVLSSGVAKLGTMLAGLVSVRTAVRLLADEYANLKDQQDKAASTQIEVGGSRLDVIRNMPGASKESRARALEASRQISARTGIGEAAVNQAVAQALSASGGDLEAVIPAVTAAANLLPDKPAELPIYAGAMLDLAKVSGTNDAAINQGLLSFVGGMSRVVDPKLQARNVPRALIGVQGYGASAAESAALYSALTVAAADPMGEESGTGAIRFAEQLREFLPAGGTAAKLGKKGEVLEAGRPGFATFGERLAFLQGNPEMARSFLAGASFEAKMGIPIEGLLTDPNSKMAREYAKNVRMMPGMGAMAGQADEMLAAIRDEPLFRQGRQQRTYTQGQEAMLLANLVGAEGGINREGLKNALLASGQGSLATKVDLLSWEWNSNVGRGGGTAEAIGLLERRQRELANPTERRSIFPGSEVPEGATMAGPSGGFQPGAMYNVPRAATESERAQAEILGSMLNELRKLNAAAQKSRPTTLAKPDEDR